MPTPSTRPRCSIGKTGRRGLYALPMGADFQPRPCLEQPARARRLHPRRYSERMGGVLVFLVRPGAAGGAQGAGPRRHLGYRAAHVSCGNRYGGRVSFSSSSRTRRLGSSPDGRLQIDDPAVRAGMVKALDAYTAIWRKGCTPPDSVGWTNIDNNKAFLAQTVVMTPNVSLSIPSALRASSPDDYYGERGDHRLAERRQWPAARHPGFPAARRGVQGRQEHGARRETSCASSPRRAGSPIG